MPLSMTFVDAILKEFYLSRIQLQLDMSRQLFWDPNPKFGPPVPAWMTSNKMFDDAPYWDPPASYWDEEEDDYGSY